MSHALTVGNPRLPDALVAHVLPPLAVELLRLASETGNYDAVNTAEIAVKAAHPEYFKENQDENQVD